MVVKPIKTTSRASGTGKGGPATQCAYPKWPWGTLVLLSGALQILGISWTGSASLVFSKA